MPLCRSCRFSLSWCRGRPHGPDCSSDHKDSPVLLQQGDRCPCCTGRADFPCRERPIPIVLAVQQTIEILLFLFDKMIDLPVVQGRSGFSRAGRQHPCREGEAASRGLSDHGDSPVSRWQRDRRPCCAGRASSSCAVVEVAAVFGVSTPSCGMKIAQGSGGALCTGTGPGFDHQGGEGVAGSPGV